MPDALALRAVADACDGDLRGDAEVTVHDVTLDSRQVREGWLFACRPGQHADGHDFAARAVEAGAAALLVERWLDLDVPQIRVPSVAAALAPVAAAVHGHPSGALLLLGVTGTNGKTTTVTALEAVLAASGLRTGLVGTVETRVAGRALAAERTTPEATDLHRLLRGMVDAGVGGVAMEVSSHGLALGRVAGLRFDIAGFTNLSQDHLDFHADMEDYFAAKARLFTPAYAERGVVCVDDDWGRRLAEEASVEVTTVGVRADDADVRAVDVRTTPSGTAFELAGMDAPTVRTPLVGDFNVANALVAAVMGVRAGLPAADVVAGLGAMRPVPGRMEPVDAGQPFGVVVDYAHTPEALARVLAAARSAADGRVLVVVGCGGDRDHAKRPAMAREAVVCADLAVLTSDNPRSEDPEAILEAMRPGAEEAGGGHVVEPDRRQAIALALGRARAGDVVVIAGKGHESTQEVAGVRHEFDDRRVAAELLGGTG